MSQHALLHVLRQLARKGARVELDTERGPCLMKACGSDVAKTNVAIDHIVWEKLVASKYIAEKDFSGTWLISKSGRTFLKRCLSAGGAQNAGSAKTLAPKAKDARSISKRAKPQLDRSESPLDRLRRRKGKCGTPLINDAQFEAGERLRGDFWKAQMTPRVTMNWSFSVGRSSKRGRMQEPDVGDGAYMAQERVRDALTAVGPELSGILIDVCCHLKGIEAAERGAGWPKRSGKVVLCMALSALARHYGLIYGASKENKTNKLRHWGAADFRPSLSQWEG